MKKLIVVFSLFLSVGAFAQKADSAKNGIKINTGSSYNSLPPLVMLDGVKYKGDINNIKPNDIESIEVLKSASATSLYGAEGLNGVILITTKKGSGKTLKPNGAVTIRTDSTSTKPLYIIDGKPSDAAGLAKIKPEDIDNISIVKDASASSIYGAAGDNGVVIVVTKAYKKEHINKKTEAERQGKN